MRGISSKVLSIEKNSLIAQVGITLLTILTRAVGISDGTDPYKISNFDKRNFLSNFSDFPNDLMTGATWVVALSPMSSDGGKIRVTDGGVEDFQPDFLFFKFLECEGVH